MHKSVPNGASHLTRSTEDEVRRAPNILWIVTTQWRAQATGYAGDPNARTPHLDALAADSVNYAQAVTPHPFGPFARAALLTGVLSPENGVRDYFDPLPVEVPTIADRLQECGYATAFFGKWHLFQRDQQADLVGPAHARIVVPPERRGGFECWEGFESGFLLNDPWLHGTRLPEPTQFAGYQSDVICDRAAGWIHDFGNPMTESGKDSRGRSCGSQTAVRQSPASGIRNRNWFCVVSLEPPHPPYTAPVPVGGGKWNPGALVLPPNVPRGGDVEMISRRELAGYYAHVEATDRAIGRLLAAAPGEDTVVVFTSVHGDMHGAHGLFRKGWPYEESVRVPLLVRVPGAREMARRGVVDPALVSLVDLPDLALGWAKGGAPVVEAEFQRISMPSVVQLPRQCDRAWRGGRTLGRKLVLGADGVPWLFFDLDRDPGEEINLCNDPSRAAEVEAFRQRL
jgi:arylsulfatase A-like enzyme